MEHSLRCPKNSTPTESRFALVRHARSAHVHAGWINATGFREITVSPLLRELDFLSPNLGGLRLPLTAWAFAVGGRILLQTLRRNYPSAAEVARIHSAVAWLEDLARQHSRVVAVTHASFRRQLFTQLVQTGWQAETERRSMLPWSAWSFQRRSDRS